MRSEQYQTLKFVKFAGAPPLTTPFWLSSCLFMEDKDH
uniref:Uncharacterized protein n=1 Tax=Rhizophora mucronata TaxID=61149 RepID=A0A2P2QGR2_RHIMU